MKVSINAGGREVTVECSDTNTSPGEIGDKALQLWKETEGAKAPSDGPAYGFMAERRADRDPSSTIRQHPGVPQ